MGRHVLEVAGSRVLIEDGEIVDVSEPKIERCPLRSKLYGIEEETVESVRKTVRFYIDEWGMFTPHRVVRSESMPVSFGVSEMFASGLRQGVLDCVVTVCEGAGTVISPDFEVVQGIGAHMTGLLETSPEDPIIAKLVDNGVTVLHPEDASMDQASGVLSAVKMGYRRIGVTITGQKPAEGPRIREICGDVAIASVHNSGMSREAAIQVASSCDIVTSCASRWAREIIGPRALMQLGLGIPVFILTPLGREIALARMKDFDGPLIVGTGDIPKLNEDQPRPPR